MSDDIVQEDPPPLDPAVVDALIYRVCCVVAEREALARNRERALRRPHILRHSRAWDAAGDRLERELDRLAALVDAGL